MSPHSYSGSALGRILHHDLRAPTPLFGSAVQEGLCSLQWSPNGDRLASGSTEGLLSVWDSGIAACTRMCSPVTTMKQPSAVKVSVFLNKQVLQLCVVRCEEDKCWLVVQAMAWCPWQRNTIATGGGYKDGKLRIWDVVSGTGESFANTNSQVLWEPRGGRGPFHCLNTNWVTPNKPDCRSVLFNGLKRRDVWWPATACLSTISPAGPGTFPRSASPPRWQVRVCDNVQQQPTVWCEHIQPHWNTGAAWWLIAKTESAEKSATFTPTLMG